MTAVAQLMEYGKEAALAAGAAIMEVYAADKPGILLKPDDSPLTAADTRAHTIIVDHLRKTNLPLLSEEGLQVDFQERKSWEYFWMIDPLDGTREFLNKNGEFTVNIALLYQDQPVGGVIYAPGLDILFSGSKETGVDKSEKGKCMVIPPLPGRIAFTDILSKRPLTVVASRSHLSPATRGFIRQFQDPTVVLLGSSLKFMHLLENQADIYPRLEPSMEWDTAAAHAILRAANRGIYHIDLGSELVYNKPDLRNPFFVAF